MKTNGNDTGSFLLIAGVLILGIFTYVSAKNILPNNSSDSFYSKGDNDVKINIESIKDEEGKLIITTSDDVYICAKKTKSVPSGDSLCWKKTTARKLETSIYSGKTYYIWLMDDNKNISNYFQYNTNNDTMTQ